VYQDIQEGAKSNYSYFPILFKNEGQLQEVFKQLAVEKIIPRRYFHPCLDELDYVQQAACPIARDISSRIACLPLSYQLEQREIERVGDIIKNSL
jgi:dTDP-4-amino-4,6-dideoxygalactose transaminase